MSTTVSVQDQPKIFVFNQMLRKSHRPLARTSLETLTIVAMPNFFVVGNFRGEKTFTRRKRKA
jgi:hypothetical protein